MPPSIARRKLAALDADDLCVISAHVQDAQVHIGDIVWRQREKRLVVGMRRLDWDQALDGAPQASRLISALRFDRVLSCQSRNIDMTAPDQAKSTATIARITGRIPLNRIIDDLSQRAR